MDAEVWQDKSFFAGAMTLSELHRVVRCHEFAVCILSQHGADLLNPNVLMELGMFIAVNGSQQVTINNPKVATTSATHCGIPVRTC